MTPKISIVTELAQMALLRPNLSETNPEQNEPSAKPKERFDKIEPKHVIKLGMQLLIFISQLKWCNLAHGQV